MPKRNIGDSNCSAVEMSTFCNRDRNMRTILLVIPAERKKKFKINSADPSPSGQAVKIKK
jgi:hypothetical protein